MQDCDANRRELTFFVVSTFPYSECLSQTGQAKGIQIDIEGRTQPAKKDYPMPLMSSQHGECPPNAGLSTIMPRLRRKTDHLLAQTVIGFESVVEIVDGAWPTHGWEQRVLNPTGFLELIPKLPDRCIISADSGRRPTVRPRSEDPPRMIWPSCSARYSRRWSHAVP